MHRSATGKRNEIGGGRSHVDEQRLAAEALGDQRGGGVPVGRCDVERPPRRLARIEEPGRSGIDRGPVSRQVLAGGGNQRAHAGGAGREDVGQFAGHGEREPFGVAPQRRGRCKGCVEPVQAVPERHGEGRGGRDGTGLRTRHLEMRAADVEAGDHRPFVLPCLLPSLPARSCGSPEVKRLRIIPVLDLKGGVVVRAAGGHRDRYRPIETPLASSPAPEAVAEGLRGLAPFASFYVADLDAIDGGGFAPGRLAALRALSPPAEIWLDAGFATAAALDAALAAS